MSSKRARPPRRPAPRREDPAAGNEGPAGRRKGPVAVREAPAPRRIGQSRGGGDAPGSTRSVNRGGKPALRRPAPIPRRKNQLERAGAPADRVQKILAAAGVGSRREVERWIREGRLQINGSVPALGAKLAARDRITLDGRPVRLHRPAGKESFVLLYHRSPGDTLDLKAATSRAAEHLQLPRVSGRWLAVQPLPPVDGGLEILTNDGSWADRVSRGQHALTMDYLLRMRGTLDAGLIEEFRAAADCEGEPMTILQADAQLGGGLNHWLTVTVRDTRPAQVRHWWAARGFIVSRLMRVRFGPVHLSRELPRGHSRAMSPGERTALVNEIDAAKPTEADIPEAPG